MKELKNRKGMDYCFPLGIMQDDNGDLYYIDPFKSLFFIILMPIRIFFPVKLYKITDKNEKLLAYVRYRDEKIQNNIVLVPIIGLSLGSFLNRLFSQVHFLVLNASLLLKIIYISFTIIGLFWMIVRRYNVLKLMKSDMQNYMLSKIVINEKIILFCLSSIISTTIIYFVFSLDSEDLINFPNLVLCVFIAPLVTLLLFGMVFKYDDLKFKIIKKINNN